jgi:hypothetical protein
MSLVSADTSIGARRRRRSSGSDAGFENIFGRIVVEDDEFVVARQECRA